MGGAFDPMWKDIDETRPGTPYVVDSTGWGWFGLFILLTVPVLMVYGIVACVTGWVVSQPVVAAGIYLGIGLVAGLLIYCLGQARFRVVGVFATVLTVLPLGLAMALYAIPYLMIQEGFSALVDWVLILIILGIISLMILFWAGSLENGLIHFLLALAFLGLVSMILYSWWTETSHDWITWSKLLELYGFSSS